MPCKEAFECNYVSVPGQILYKADYDKHADGYWLPASKMPVEYIRTHLTILSVRPVRVEHVTEAEALAMGFEPVHMCQVEDGHPVATHDSYAEAFRDYWRSRHKGKDWFWLYGVKVETK